MAASLSLHLQPVPSSAFMSSMKAIILENSGAKPGPSCYHPVPLKDIPIPVPGEGQVLVKILAAAFNHRDVFLRQSLYPGLLFSAPDKPSVMGADAVGIVVSPNSEFTNKAVLIAPAVGWLDRPDAPENPPTYGILGSVKQTGGRGTFAEYIVVGNDDVVACPEHFLNRGKEGYAEAAALPLGGLTAYRAVFTKANVKKGDNVYITGIGGGVAITALQYCVAVGANVWVSSSSEEKIKKAVALGAKGGVNYRDEKWAKTLATLLPKDHPYLDAIIDSGGGNIINPLVKILRPGAIVACFGQTSMKGIELGMQAVMSHIELKGSTMGSLKEFKDSVAFVGKHKIRPVVHTALNGLNNAEEGFELLKQGGQFGKVVITIADEKGKL